MYSNLRKHIRSYDDYFILFYFINGKVVVYMLFVNSIRRGFRIVGVKTCTVSKYWPFFLLQTRSNLGLLEFTMSISIYYSSLWLRSMFNQMLRFTIHCFDVLSPFRYCLLERFLLLWRTLIKQNGY